MKPWIVMAVLVGVILAARWFLWAYPGIVEASAHIGRLLPGFSVS